MKVLVTTCNTLAALSFLLIGLPGCSPKEEKTASTKPSQNSQEAQSPTPDYPKWKLRASGTKDTAKEDGFTSCKHIGSNDAQKEFRCAHEQPYSMLGVSIGVPYIVLSEISQYKYDIVKFDIQGFLPPEYNSKETDLCKGGIDFSISEQADAISSGKICRTHFKLIKKFQENLKSDGWTGFSSKKGDCSCSYYGNYDVRNCMRYVKPNTPVIVEVAYNVGSTDYSSIFHESRNSKREIKPVVCLKNIPSIEADRIYNYETNLIAMEAKKKADEQAGKDGFIRSMSK